VNPIAGDAQAAYSTGSICRSVGTGTPPASGN
jgi:hypothetical protein